MAYLTLKDVNKIYPNGFHAVHDFNLEIEKGEFIVFVGSSGCGKSTTLRMIAGLEDISKGEFLIDGKRANEMGPRERGIAMVFQSYALYPHMSVYDNLAFGLTLQGVDEDVIDEKVRRTAAVLGLTDYLERMPRALSGGQRQRVALGRAMVRNPAVFLLDEPLSNLDAKLRVQMRTEITKLHQKLQTTFIYVTHDQTEAMTMGSRIVVMKDGFIQQVDTPQNLYDYPTNLFVAGFIGSPQMNFFNAKLEKIDGKVYATFGENKILVPAEKLQKFVSDECIGKEVYLGIRPENINDAPEFVAKNPDSSIKVHVEVVELMGSETYLYLSTSGKEGNIVARVDPRSKSRTNDDITVAFDTSRLHFFDRDTETTLLTR